MFLGTFSPNLLIATLWVMFGLTLITAIQRFFKVWKQASVGRPQPPQRPVNRRRARDARRSQREPLSGRWRKQ